MSLVHLLDTLTHFETTGEWKTGNEPLRVGKFAAIPPQFVPADSSKTSPWNGVLKNNFWAGSHVLELFDAQKSDVKFLIDKPELLIQLAELIRPFVPIGIDGLSDRLGGILIQLPVTSITTSIQTSSDGDFIVEPVWHPDVPARPLRVSAEMHDDFVIEGFASQTVLSGRARLPLHSERGGARQITWDDENHVILAASADTAFTTSISMQMNLVGGTGGAYREFMLLPESTNPTRVALKAEVKPTIIGKPIANPRAPWLAKRVFRDSQYALRARKEFVQYGGPSTAGRVEALDDLRWLIAQHGKAGVWLWDPYLSAADILETLFFCPHPGADLRALSAAEEPRQPRVASPVCPRCDKVYLWMVTKLRALRLIKPVAPSAVVPSWTARQRDALERTRGDGAGLNMEFRVREGNLGWAFHDRFIIFPNHPDGSLAWSLGTSVNSLGQQHHVLQKIPDGELMRLAFLELWDQLNGPEHLVWKFP